MKERWEVNGLKATSVQGMLRKIEANEETIKQAKIDF